MPGPADGLPRAARHRPARPTSPAGSPAPTPASPTTTPTAHGDRRACSSASTRAYYIDAERTRRRRCSSAAASPTTSSPSTRRCASSTAPRRDHPRHAGLAAARRLRPPARGEQAGRPRAPAATTIHAWFDHYLRGDGRGAAARRHRRPRRPARATRRRRGRSARRTSPRSRAARSASPRTTPQTIASGGGDPDTAPRDRPGRRRRRRLRGHDRRPTPPGTAVYRLPAATGDGYTLLGAPAIDRRACSVTGDAEPRAGRRAPVGRRPGRRRPDARRARRLPAPGGAHDVWQLHANGWRFAPGHVAKLELLGADAPYGRAVERPVRRSASSASSCGCRCASAPTTPGRRARCASRRRFTVRVPRGTHARPARGRRLRVRRGRVTVDLRGRPRVTAVLRLRVRGGRTVVRRYRTCVRRRTS